jgi:hypothetical protein
MMMKMKKQRSSADVTWALKGMVFGKELNEGQIAVSIVWTHCPPWKDCVPNLGGVRKLRLFDKKGATYQIHATTPLTKTPKYAPYTPKVDLIRTGKFTPYTQPM